MRHRTLFAGRPGVHGQQLVLRRVGQRRRLTEQQSQAQQNMTPAQAVQMQTMLYGHAATNRARKITRKIESRIRSGGTGGKGRRRSGFSFSGD
jgi:hypothetical protein